jgi:hypothetical protein
MNRPVRQPVGAPTTSRIGRPSTNISGRARTVTVVASAVAVLIAGPAPGATAAAEPGRDGERPAPVARAGASGASTTSAEEARRVDRVPTPRLRWYPCGDSDCSTVRLPLDYDDPTDPTGPTTELAVRRTRASDPTKKIGTLFVNPGGPGGR